MSQTGLLADLLVAPDRLPAFDDAAVRWSGAVRNVALINSSAGLVRSLDWTARLEALPTLVFLAHGVTAGEYLGETVDLISSPGYVYLAAEDPLGHRAGLPGRCGPWKKPASTPADGWTERNEMAVAIGPVPAISHDAMLVFLVQIGVLLIVATALGRLAARLNLPAVVGELAAGILVGPSSSGPSPPRCRSGCSRATRSRCICSGRWPSWACCCWWASPGPISTSVCCAAGGWPSPG